MAPLNISVIKWRILVIIYGIICLIACRYQCCQVYRFSGRSTVLAHKSTAYRFNWIIYCFSYTFYQLFVYELEIENFIFEKYIKFQLLPSKQNVSRLSTDWQQIRKCQQIDINCGPILLPFCRQNLFT